MPDPFNVLYFDMYSIQTYLIIKYVTLFKNIRGMSFIGSYEQYVCYNADILRGIVHSKKKCSKQEILGITNVVLSSWMESSFALQNSQIFDIVWSTL